MYQYVQKFHHEFNQCTFFLPYLAALAAAGLYPPAPGTTPAPPPGTPCIPPAPPSPPAPRPVPTPP